MTDGLEGVIAAETRLSLVDGQAGRLVIAGHDVEELVDGPPFDAVLAMLWEGLVADLPPTAKLGRHLGEARAAVFERLAPRVPLVAASRPWTRFARSSRNCRMVKAWTPPCCSRPRQRCSPLPSSGRAMD